MKNVKFTRGMKRFLIGSSFLVESFIVFAAAFFYSHWTAYSIAAQHLDGQTSLLFFWESFFWFALG